MQETGVWSLVWFLEKEMATHSSILAWKIPWTEEPGGVTKNRTLLSDWTTTTSIPRIAVSTWQSRCCCHGSFYFGKSALVMLESWPWLGVTESAAAYKIFRPSLFLNLPQLLLCVKIFVLSMKFLRNRLQLGRWPLRKQRKGICVRQETGRRFLTKQYVCSKEKKKK